MCPHCQSPKPQVSALGFFPKKSTRAPRVKRYRCRSCHVSFSTQTGGVTYRQKKPHINHLLFQLFASGVSQRNCARMLKINPKTVANRIKRFGEFARKQRQLTVKDLLDPKRKTVVFDEMETFEASKCKPLSIALALQEKSRVIIDANVAIMPAKGLLVKKARRYGHRPDQRRAAVLSVLKTVADVMPKVALVKSDECPRYPWAVRKCLAGTVHKTFKGRRPKAAGFGELKRGGFDPLFSLNHTCAMARYRMAPLQRRTWCTTKKAARLQDRLDIFIWYHNQLVTSPKRRPRL